MAAVAGLLQHRALQLCPSAAAEAADAALRLLSALQATCLASRQGQATSDHKHRLWEQVQLMDSITVALRQCITHLPNTPAPGAVDSAAAMTAEDELGSLVRRLGFRSSDLEAAQLDLSFQTQAALGQRGHNHHTATATLAATLAVAQAAPLGAAQGRQAVQPPPALDALLTAAVATTPGLPLMPPEGQQPGSGGQSLLSTVQQVLCVLRQLSQQQAQLATPGGWESYWLLEPLALHQTLAELLQAATGGGPGQSLEGLLPQQPHWAALLPAVCRQPVLHLAARQALHEWLAASGSLAAWDLLALLVQRVKGASRQELLQGGPLPPELRVLYCPTLWPLAALLHCEAPSPGGLVRVSGLLHQAAVQRGQAGCVEGGWACCREIWQLLLDCPAWLCLAVQCSRVEAALARCCRKDSPGAIGLEAPQGGGPPTAAAAEGGEGSAEAAAAPPTGTAEVAAAQLLAWAMWPHGPAQRHALVAVLAGEQGGGAQGDVVPGQVAPWLEQLWRWEVHWRQRSGPRRPGNLPE